MIPAAFRNSAQISRTTNGGRFARVGVAAVMLLTSLSVTAAASEQRTAADTRAHSTTHAAATAPARGRGLVPGWTWFETQVWRLTNAERVKAGLAPLAPNPCLRDVAISWSNVLNARGELTHGDFPARIRQCTGRRHYSGENVAYGYASPAELVAAWMNSPHHRDNILDRSFRYLGVGTAGDETVYASQVFAAGFSR